MSKFNSTIQARTATTNLAGGKAYSESPKLELASLLITSTLQDQFYRSESQQMKALKGLITKIDPIFVAKAAIYARNEFGVRSITHVVAGELGKTVKGQKWTKSFFEKVVRRPDDILEILAYYKANHGDSIPNSMKKGLGAVLSKLSEHALAKYKSSNSDIKMVDAINLLHPKHSDAIEALIKGKLKTAETWETKLTQAGQKAENEDDLKEVKSDAWKSLLLEKKLGYMALIRNIRNILEHCPELVSELCEQLVNEAAIKKSLMFPFRFMTALEQVTDRNVIRALNKAIDISLANVPKFDGKTLIALDTSGSMTSGKCGSSSAAKVGALFAAVLYKVNDAELMSFSDDAQYVNLNPDDSTLTLAGSIPFRSGGTNFNSIFFKAKNKYDRIIILSDMQGWIMGGAPSQSLANYRNHLSANPKIYSFDLCGYGTLQFPENNVYCMAGFSDKVFDIMGLLERDRNALVNAIEKIEL
jgi:60 kDa SS-A/Ro ribonucleoprotein